MSNAIYPLAVRGLTFPVLKRALFKPIIVTGPNQYEVRVAQNVNPVWEWQLIYDYVDDGTPQTQFSPYSDYRILQGFHLARGGQYDDFLFDDITDDQVGPPMWRANWLYALGDTVVDDGGFLQTVTTPGISGYMMPSFSFILGGITADGTYVKWTNGGAYPAIGTAGQTMQLVQDSTSGIWYTPVQRNFGGQFFEDITDVNEYFDSGTPYVFANGVLQEQGGGGQYNLIGPGVAVNGYSYLGLVLQWDAEPTAPITAMFPFYFRVRFETDGLDFEQFLRTMWTNGGSESKEGKGYIDLITSRPNPT